MSNLTIGRSLLTAVASAVHGPRPTVTPILIGVRSGKNESIPTRVWTFQKTFAPSLSRTCAELATIMSRIKKLWKKPIKAEANGSATCAVPSESVQTCTVIISSPSLTPSQDLSTGTPISTVSSWDVFNQSANPATQLKQKQKTSFDVGDKVVYLGDTDFTNHGRISTITSIPVPDIAWVSYGIEGQEHGYPLKDLKLYEDLMEQKPTESIKKDQGKYDPTR